MRFTARLLVTALAITGASVSVTAPLADAAPTVNATTCTGLDVVIARGTGEPGPLGMIVGGPVYRALQSTLTGTTLSAYPVNYPASTAPNSPELGNTDLVRHVEQQAAACPDQRFVLVGYSQGANVVDNSIGISSAGAVVGGPIVATIPADLGRRVTAILVFGPPIGALGKHITGPYAARSDEFCANGDPICQAGGNNMWAHLSYGRDANTAAAFVAGKV